MQTTLQVLTEIIAEKLEIDPGDIHANSTFRDLGLDSLDTFDIIFKAEDSFNIKVPNDQVAITTLQDVVDLVDSLIAAQAAESVAAQAPEKPAAQAPGKSAAQTPDKLLAQKA